MPEQSARLEEEQRALEARLADPALFQQDPEAFNAAAARLPEVEAAQMELLERWEAIEARLAALEA